MIECIKCRNPNVYNDYGVFHCVLCDIYFTRDDLDERGEGDVSGGEEV